VRNQDDLDSIGLGGRDAAGLAQQPGNEGQPHQLRKGVGHVEQIPIGADQINERQTREEKAHGLWQMGEVLGGQKARGTGGDDDVHAQIPPIEDVDTGAEPQSAHAAFALYREIYVGHSDAAAWTEARTAMMEGYRNYLRWGHLVDDEGIPIPPENDAVLEELARKRFILGGPETCLEAVLRLKEELGITHLIARMKFPGLAQELSMRSVRLFAEKVMPHV